MYSIFIIIVTHFTIHCIMSMHIIPEMFTIIQVTVSAPFVKNSQEKADLTLYAIQQMVQLLFTTTTPKMLFSLQDYNLNPFSFYCYNCLSTWRDAIAVMCIVLLLYTMDIVTMATHVRANFLMNISFNHCQT